MATYNTIIAAFNTFAANHLQLHTFYSGGTWDFQSKTNIYPALIAYALPSTIMKGQVQLNFNIFTLDILNKDRTNRDDVLSDMLQVMQDFVSEFKDNEDDYGFTLVEDNVIIDPLEEEFDDVVCGWVATVSIVMEYSGSDCIIPSSP